MGRTPHHVPSHAVLVPVQIMDIAASTQGPTSIGSDGAAQHVERFAKSLYKTAGLLAPICTYTGTYVNP